MKTILKVVTTLFAETIGDERACVRTPGNGAGKSEAAVPILEAIAADWRCWRLRGEPDRQFAYRLGLHLQTLAVALEDDLGRVLAAEKEIRQRSSENE